MRNLNSLKLNKEFKRAYYRGKFKAHPLLITYLVPNGQGICRVGITTGKKAGNAVCRSRARRIIRAAYLSVRDKVSFPKGVDLVFVAREQTPNAKSTELAVIMQKQLAFLQKAPPQKHKKK